MKPLQLQSRIQLSKNEKLNLLEYLCRRFTYLDHSGWQQQLENGMVSLNHLTASGNEQLQGGDLLSWTRNIEEPTVRTDFKIIYQDEFLTVVNKPAPIPCHPSGVFIENTLIHQVRLKTQNFKLNLCHRLDRETSGVILLSDRSDMQQKTEFFFANSQISKTYLAICEKKENISSRLQIRGWQNSGTGIIRQKQVFQAEFSQGFKTCETRLRRIAQNPDTDCWMICPRQGRTHQIRLALQQAGLRLKGEKNLWLQ